MKRAGAVLLAMTLALTACGDGGSDAVDEIVLVTHESFVVSPEVLDDFTAETGISVSVLQAGDAGAMVNTLVLTRDDPLGHVVFGIDNTFLSRALEAGILVSYEPAGLEGVPEELRLDDRATPIDFSDVCVNYDKAALVEAGLQPPASLRDLADPGYAGTLVVQDPSTSSPGLAFLLATIATFPEDSAYPWQQFWEDLRANDVLVTPGWQEAYYGEFAGGGEGGTRPLVVSYATSPPAGVIFSDVPLDEAPTAVLTDGCFRQIEFAGILDGGGGGEAAEQFMDFMLDVRFQEDIPLNMFVFPAVSAADLPREFVEFTDVPENPASLDPDLIEEERSNWIQEWTSIVLR